eukprot:403337769
MSHQKLHQNLNKWSLRILNKEIVEVDIEEERKDRKKANEVVNFPKPFYEEFKGIEKRNAQKKFQSQRKQEKTEKQQNLNQTQYSSQQNQGKNMTKVSFFKPNQQMESIFEQSNSQIDLQEDKAKQNKNKRKSMIAQLNVSFTNLKQELDKVRSEQDQSSDNMRDSISQNNNNNQKQIQQYKPSQSKPFRGTFYDTFNKTFFTETETNDYYGLNQTSANVLQNQKRKDSIKERNGKQAQLQVTDKLQLIKQVINKKQQNNKAIQHDRSKTSMKERYQQNDRALSYENNNNANNPSQNLTLAHKNYNSLMQQNTNLQNIKIKSQNLQRDQIRQVLDVIQQNQSAEQLLQKAFESINRDDIKKSYKQSQDQIGTGAGARKYQAEVVQRIKDSKRETEKKHEAEVAYIAAMMPTALGMYKFEKIMKKNKAFESQTGYQIVSKIQHRRDHERLEYLLNNKLSAT